MGFFGLHEGIMAENHADLSVRIHQRQAQPELENVRLLPWGHWYNTLRGSRAFHNFLISCFPIGPLIAQIKLGDTTPRGLNTHIVTQSRTSEAHTQLQRLRRDDIVQTQ